MAKKITKKELTSVKEVNDRINNEVYNLGLLETNKLELLQKLQNAKNELNVLQVDLEKKYGKVVIDLQDGAITEPEKDEE